ncbi:UNKNOWN [Stylonychia lemnae]|uniref:Uncharacterized protein n=1 Tax=Stylonychia lemnae TaxID=5949 RepID=A0A078A584_STYLE|nr:UNKNOWN [Stylonychia lemnae]|eukprot:CDW75909.1 UNKNOWN [Stylonychia lemnae]
MRSITKTLCALFGLSVLSFTSAQIIDPETYIYSLPEYDVPMVQEAPFVSQQYWANDRNGLLSMELMGGLSVQDLSPEIYEDLHLSDSTVSPKMREIQQMRRIANHIFNMGYDSNEKGDKLYLNMYLQKHNLKPFQVKQIFKFLDENKIIRQKIIQQW